MRFGTQEGGSEESQWSAHDYMAKYITSEIIPNIGDLRRQATNQPCIEHTRAWFEECESLATLCRPVLSTTIVKGLDHLSQKYQETEAQLLRVKPGPQMFANLQKIVKLYNIILIEGLQAFKYLFKMQPTQRTAREQVENYVKAIYDDEDI